MEKSDKSPDSSRRLLAGALVILAAAIVIGVWYYRSTTPFERCVKEMMKLNPEQGEPMAMYNCKSIVGP